MCMICHNPSSSQDDLKKAEAKHKLDRLMVRAIELKELIEDCRKILRIHSAAGTRDFVTEYQLNKYIEAQYELSKTM